MTQLALVIVPAPTLALVHSTAEPTDGQLDALAAAYVTADWTPDAEDAERLASLLCEQAVEDLASDDLALRLAVEDWLDIDAEETFAWCAAVLGESVDRLEAQIREQVELRRSRAYWHRREIEAAHGGGQLELGIA